MLQMQGIGDEGAAAEYRIAWLSHRAHTPVSTLRPSPPLLPGVTASTARARRGGLGRILSVALFARFVPTR